MIESQNTSRLYLEWTTRYLPSALFHWDPAWCCSGYSCTATMFYRESLRNALIGYKMQILTPVSVLFASAGKIRMSALLLRSELTKQNRAVALVRGVHNMRPVASTSPNKFAAPATKIASIVLPIIMVTIPFAPALQQHGVLCLIITCAPSTSFSQVPYHHTQLT
jgi:hypothetical protein